MLNYKAYFFDFDYTLVNSEKGIITCFQYTLEKLGYPSADNDIIRHTIGMPLKEAASLVTGDTNKEHIDLFFSTFLDFADTYMTPGTEFYPDTLSVLKELHNRGKKIAIVSSKRSFRIKEKFTLEKATDLIDLILGNTEIKNLKPAPDGLLQALDILKLKKADVLYIGDSTIDAEAAQRADISFAAVTTGTTTAKEFESYPHKKILHNLSELL